MARTRTDAPDAVIDAPALDFAALASSAVRTEIRSGKNRFGGVNNPFIPLVRESYEEDTKEWGSGWRENSILGSQVRQMAAALRNAAQMLSDEGIGIRIKYEFRSDEDSEWKGEVVEIGDARKVPEDERKVVIKYTGRTKKEYSKSADDDTAAEEDDENGDGES